MVPFHTLAWSLLFEKVLFGKFSGAVEKKELGKLATLPL